MLQRLLIACALAFGAAGVTVGCNGPVERTIDCNDICGDYDECFSGEIDRSECVDHCNNQPAGQIDECDACLDSEDMGCFDCAAECVVLTD
jgi:hypothetical protein